MIASMGCRRPWPVVLVVLGLLAPLAGCGSSSGGRSHASHSAAGRGSRVYAGTEFRITIPTGFERGATITGAGGASGTVFLTADNRATISVHAYPHSNQGVQQALADQMLSDSLSAQQGAIRQLHSHARPLTVAGARDAKELTQTFVTAHGRQRLAELIVLSSSGTLIDASATASDAAGVDPGAVVSSLQLNVP